MDLYDIQQTCNKIAETFIYNTPEYNGCVISLRLHNKNPDEIDEFYHIAYYAKSNFKLVLGANSSFPYVNPEDVFGCLVYHDSAWRYAIEYKFERKLPNVRTISISSITPVNWQTIEYIDRDSIYHIDSDNGKIEEI